MNNGLDTLDALSRFAYMAEVREWDNRHHIDRVRRYCLAICRELDLTQDEQELISDASMLHDIGKVYIPDNLIHFIGNYYQTEREIIENHTKDGSKLLANSKVPLFQVAETIAISHHERWNGSGYPYHLQGEDIPLAGRICAVADVFDSLTSERSYKPSIGFDEAYTLLSNSSNSLFDPNILDIFNKIRPEVTTIYNSTRMK